MKRTGSGGLGFGKFVRETREMLGVSQDQFAELLGVSCSCVVSYWESGRNFPRRETVEAIGRLVNEHRRLG